MHSTTLTHTHTHTHTHTAYAHINSKGAYAKTDHRLLRIWNVLGTLFCERHGARVCV